MLWKSIFRTGPPTNERNQVSLVLNTFILHLHPAKIERDSLRFSYTFCLGGTSFLLFLVLTVTGVLLMFYYHPSPHEAYADMVELSSVVSFGRLLRNLHRWAAHGMVITVLLHMIRVFTTGSYKPPREFNWVIGVSLLVLTLALSFTGYLLPWDQLAYWAITVGTSIVDYAPLVGGGIKYLLLGDDQIGANALLRFYVLHCVALPILVVVLMGLHFWRIRKDGGISVPL